MAERRRRILSLVPDEKKRLDLKNGAGFYDYEDDAASRTFRTRDDFLQRRLHLFNLENSERD
ncbi:MAG: hypothetical protein H0S80_00655 [Desulfovibrionaceae bacterium]|nr:hypothetical protein [Desulfovibrionaceae bacterium]